MSAIIHFETKPPCWPRLEKEFSVRWVPGVTVTYGGEIYTHGKEIKDDVLVHEMVHVGQQQGIEPEDYLDRYINDREFRKEMELAAYVIHNAYLRATMKDDAKLWTRLYTNVKAFAMTCNIDLEEADKMIANYQQPKIIER